jgi:tRNA 2-thiouridine synthesizing protein D
MTEYSVLITTSPFHGDTAIRALAFIKAAIANGDSINNVFFYGDGVYHTNSLMLHTGDSHFAYGDWENLANTHSIQLLVCITAAVKRGIVSQQEADANGINFSNLNAPFQQAGLGEFFTALHECDKLVQF